MSSSAIGFSRPIARDVIGRGTSFVIAEPAVEDEHVGFRERTVDPELADFGLRDRGLQRFGIRLRILAPRQQRCEALADRHDRARRVLDDAERSQAGREELDRAEQRQVPRCPGG